MPSLTRAEATVRAALITVESYHVDLDLTGAASADRFRSAVTVRFRAAAGTSTFAEVKPARLTRVRLNDADLDPAALADNRLPLAGLRAANTLTVEAEMAYSNTGRGCTGSSTRRMGRRTCTRCPSWTMCNASSPPSTSRT
ncbi:hypothetical protein GCM10027605_57730 [Micromonospora zhanjiangensis]